MKKLIKKEKSTLFFKKLRKNTFIKRENYGFCFKVSKNCSYELFKPDYWKHFYYKPTTPSRKYT